MWYFACSVFDFTQQNQDYITVFPNPSSSSVIFKINLPDNINEYKLITIDRNSNIVSSQELNSNQGNYSIDFSNLKNGSYFYYLSTKNKSLQKGKFVIIK